MPKEISLTDYVMDIKNLWSNPHPYHCKTNSLETQYLRPLKTDYQPDYQKNQDLRLNYYPIHNIPVSAYIYDRTGIDSKTVIKDFNQAKMNK
jgi:hypothetical protein